MDGFCRFLRRVFPSATANQIAAVSGVPSGTADKWLRGESKPSLEHFGALISAFGPPLLAAVFPHIEWVSEAAKQSRALEIETEIARLEQERAQL